MARFNTSRTRPTGTGVLQTAVDEIGRAITAPTALGGAGFRRDSRSELFLLGAANFHGQDTFHENALTRDHRFTALVRTNAIAHPDWTASFIGYLRSGAHMRTAPLVAAADYATAMYTEAGRDLWHGSRRPAAHARPRAVVGSALLRADEPGEFLAYWFDTYGRNLPKGVKRGLADAMLRLYTPRSALKYDTASKGIRFGDMVDYVEPNHLLGGDVPGRVRVRDERERRAFYGYLLDRRRGNGTNPVPRMIALNQQLRRAAADDPTVLLDPAALLDAGMNWQDALSLAGDRVDRKALWEALIPSMGIQAIARNLRNFDEAGVSDEMAQLIVAGLTDPEQIARSRMLPFEWYLAYREAPSLRWGAGLETALQLSTANIPALLGRSLVLIDTSGSMDGAMSGGTLRRHEAAAVFAFALAAQQQEVDVFGFGNVPYEHVRRRGGSVLTEVKRFVAEQGKGGHGTYITESIRKTYRPGYHKRIFVFTDEQTASRHPVDSVVGPNVPFYGFNLVGYRTSIVDTTNPNRIQLGGLTDHTFTALDVLERGVSARWPWEDASR